MSLHQVSQVIVVFGMNWCALLNDDESAVDVDNVDVGAVQLAEDVGCDDVVNRADSVAIRRKV